MFLITPCTETSSNTSAKIQQTRANGTVTLAYQRFCLGLASWSLFLFTGSIITILTIIDRALVIVIVLPELKHGGAFEGGIEFRIPEAVQACVCVSMQDGGAYTRVKWSSVISHVLFLQGLQLLHVARYFILIGC